MRPRVTTCLLQVILGILVLAAWLPGAAGATGFVDQQVKAGVLLLQNYINASGQANRYVFPAKAMVKKGGGLTAPIWPANPWTGKTMAPGTGRGTYTYTPSADRTRYTFTAHLSRGSYKLSGGMPAWFKSERDQATRTGVALIGEAIMRYARLSGSALPASGAQTELIAPLTWPWPLNADTGAPMTLATTLGDYGYTHTASSFTLTGHLSGGKHYTVTRTLAESD
jgi:hypothetical protein